jgi:signal transduction histidine kinase
VNLQRFLNASAGERGLTAGLNQKSIASSQSSNETAGSWESFVGLWDRASLVRGYFWNHGVTGNKSLLTQCLVRLRRFYGIDFAFSALRLDDEKWIEAAVPEAAGARLPINFSRRCLDLVANSRAPIAWNETNSQFYFRSTVVAPLASPLGRPFGFLLLGHTTRRSYSAAELFLLQVFAGELSWALRDLKRDRQRQRQIEGLSHDIRNALQVAVGNAALIRQGLRGLASGEWEKYVGNIESSAQQILQSLDRAACAGIDEDDGREASGEPAVDIAAEVTEAVEACRDTLRPKGVRVEVVFAPPCPGEARIEPLSFKRLLSALLGAVADGSRSEAIRLTVKREASGLQLSIDDSGEGRTAERLKSLFEPAGGTDRSRAGAAEEIRWVQEYLEKSGGDVYLRSRPGGDSEFVVCLSVCSDRSAARDV